MWLNKPKIKSAVSQRKNKQPPQSNDIKKGKVFYFKKHSRLEFRFWKIGNQSCRFSSETLDPPPSAPAFFFGGRQGYPRGEGEPMQVRQLGR